MKQLVRQKYISRLVPFMGKPLIKVLIGQRRVGKSVLLEIIAKKLKSEGNQIIFIDKESYEFDHIKNYQDLMDYISDIASNEKVAIFVDEIQEIENFEKALRNFYKKPGFDIYITGSNANLLSGELATLLAGRYIEIEVFPLDYREYLALNNLDNSENNFQKYMQFGGMPGLSILPNESHPQKEYLQNIFNSIMYRDVIKKNQIRNVEFLENLISYIADNVGSPLSAKKISEYLKSQRINVSLNTVIDYLKFLANSFIIRQVKRQEIIVKKIFEIGEKYYFEDIGIRNIIRGFASTDIHKIMENVVFNHLKANGYDIKTGVLGSKEIDFVAQKSGETYYFQVTYLLNSESTIEREFGNLLAIPDNFKKYVISADTLSFTNTHKGIIHMNLREFLFLFE